MKKYNSFWEFLKATPRNLTSVLLIWGMSIAGIILFAKDMEASQTETIWRVLYFSFIGLIMFLGILRVWLLYKKNR